MGASPTLVLTRRGSSRLQKVGLYLLTSQGKWLYPNRPAWRFSDQARSAFSHLVVVTPNRHSPFARQIAARYDILDRTCSPTPRFAGLIMVSLWWNYWCHWHHRRTGRSAVTGTEHGPASGQSGGLPKQHAPNRAGHGDVRGGEQKLRATGRRQPGACDTVNVGPIARALPDRERGGRQSRRNLDNYDQYPLSGISVPGR